LEYLAINFSLRSQKNTVTWGDLHQKEQLDDEHEQITAMTAARVYHFCFRW